MGELIDDLLSLSRVCRGELTRERVDLSAIASSIADGLRRVDPHRVVEFEIAPALLVDGDPSLLSLLLDHLLCNACKLTSRKSRERIAVGRTRAPGGGTFFVAD